MNGVEINRPSRVIDDRCTRNAERRDVAARQGAARDRLAQRALPCCISRAGVDCLDDVAFACDNQHPPIADWARANKAAAHRRDQILERESSSPSELILPDPRSGSEQQNCNYD